MVLLKQGPITWLYYLCIADSNEGGENWGDQGLSRVLINLGHSDVFRFINFYKQFIKDFSEIVFSFNLMKKMMALLALARLACTKTNENELGIDYDSDIGGGKINNKIANLSISMKKMSSKAGFLTLEAS